MELLITTMTLDDTMETAMLIVQSMVIGKNESNWMGIRKVIPNFFESLSRYPWRDIVKMN